ncbi:ATP-binding protein [Campylobacter sp. RM16192]|uniref:ATP-binding protein n=1 Tax=Campylobacter sp. RM16192 TaxID=1660080 RepID=UPI0014529429|nr:ATP-binding protein [Campylobacter sp. RM16192]QCD51691.1 ATPase, AAA family (DUF4143 domain) [Campylobacter sp. RM16192]
MDILNHIYNLPLKSIKFIDRKFSISSPKILIIGPSGSGKTSLVIDSLKRFKNEEKLYINLSDIRINSEQILDSLADFLSENRQIKTLAIDNINSEIQVNKITQILDKNLENIILATDKKSINLPNFKILNLNYLDYEEFIAFFRKNFDEDTLFSQFLSHGRSLASAFLDTSEVTESLQNSLKKNLNEISINILRECAIFQGQNLSAHELYKNLKEKMKISKDSVYGILNELEERGYISLVEKFNEPNSAKKLYFEDFGLRNALSFKKDFAKFFVNVVFCELFKFKEQVFYTKDFDFFLYKRKLAILSIPFGDSDLIFLKFKKLHANLKELGANRLQVITMGNSGELSIEGIKCEVVPFSRWALGL